MMSKFVIDKENVGMGLWSWEYNVNRSPHGGTWPVEVPQKAKFSWLLFLFIYY